MKLKLFFLSLFFVNLLVAQDVPKNWHLLSPAEGYPGVSAENLYKRLPKDVKPDTVIVAVIDGGVDYMHEDLKNIMWKNPGEIPGNNIDDDKNGYVDDVYGWNFIGNAKGENVHYDNLEVARLYAKYKKRFDGVDPASLKKKEREEYNFYLKVKEETEDGRQQFKQNYDIYTVFSGAVDQIKEAFADKDSITIEDLNQFKSNDPGMGRILQVVMAQMNNGATFEAFAADIKEGYSYFKERYEYNFNPDYNARQFVDDNYADKSERIYGNPDVKGPDAFHGTHVAGIIAAQRGNDVGMDGVASVVKIMALRVVPGGDERDKDVANAIYYAVDNGATVINMSFGKGYSPYKKVVDDAVKYAAKKDVLLVHAAGNDGHEITDSNNFPTDKFAKKGLFGPKVAPNWVEVGAINWEGGEKIVAGFSNFSKEYVDVFAPGTAIYSTTPENEYKNSQGTSMASPVVAGVAAVLRAYFPDLSAVQVKEIIETSSDKESMMVIKPGSEDKVPFNELSTSGGMVNLESAIETAIKTTGKKKKAGKRKAIKLGKKPRA